MRFLAELVTFAALGLVQSPDASPTSKDPKEQAARPATIPQSHMIDDPKKYEAGILKGRAEAEKQIELDKADIWTDGPNPELFSELLERQTGLYLTYIPTRLSDDEMTGRIDGHNARILEYIRKHGPPKNSLKPWEKELFGLEKYFENQSRDEKPIRLRVGGPEAKSPDGRYLVRLVNRLVKPLHGESTQVTHLRVGEVDIKVSTLVDRFDDAELIWGPAGSWFAVLKYQGKNPTRMDYTAIDLRGLRRIRTDWELAREPVKRPAPLSPPLPIANPWK